MRIQPATPPNYLQQTRFRQFFTWKKDQKQTGDRWRGRAGVGSPRWCHHCELQLLRPRAEQNLKSQRAETFDVCLTGRWNPHFCHKTKTDQAGCFFCSRLTFISFSLRWTTSLPSNVWDKNTLLEFDEKHLFYSISSFFSFKKTNMKVLGSVRTFSVDLASKKIRSKSDKKKPNIRINLLRPYPSWFYTLSRNFLQQLISRQKPVVWSRVVAC